MLSRFASPLVRKSIRATLRGSFRRICWTGELPDAPTSVPVVVYSNHNHFLDGHLLWLVANELFRRRFVVWMEELDRFPFFAAVGAMPFPSDESERRSATVLRTRSILKARPDSVLAYFPGGALREPERRLPSPDPRTFERLARIMAPAVWMPIAIHVTWWGESKPTALLASGPLHQGITGDEMKRLAEVLEDLRTPDPTITATLLEGSRGPNERWNLSFLRRLFLPC